jgi:hypothetical protein
MEKVERNHGATLEEIIARMTSEGKNRMEMATQLGISYWTLMSWLRELGATFETSVSFPRELSGTGAE